VGRRIRWLGVVMVICFALVVIQLANIQFRQASALANSPLNPRNAIKKFDNVRGSIMAADGTVLAKSVKINSSSTTYNYEREYPGGSLYGGITGYDSIYYGTSGIEFEYNQYLQAHTQPPKNFSQLLFDRPPSEPDNVTLTIDPTLQAAALQALQTAPLANRDGAVVALNPTTGAVLAMASNPTFDPNGESNPSVPDEIAAHTKDATPDSEGFDGLSPIATQHGFPPGSTFKVITSTAVYNLKPSLTNYSFPSAPSVIFSDSGGIPLTNDGGSACGGTMALMLPQSCDPGYGALGVQLGVPTLTKQAQDFGYAISGSKSPYVPGLDLPNVSPSVFSALQPQAQAFLAQSAIGQYNDLSTPLEGALVAAGIANGGVIMTPHLMQQITGSQGDVVTTYKPKAMLTAATPAAAAAVAKLMVTVANNTVHDATANGIFPVSWHVAVKTGTAQVQAPVGPEQTDDWMIGFMPAVGGAAQIAVAVVVPQQSFTGTGAGEAGPILKQVFQSFLNESAGGPS
jgi:peptidoglycan glycosyltransferase